MRVPRQWGRGRVAAERLNSNASMRPFQAWRQWGRGRVAAERLWKPTSCRPETRVNGAAAEWPRNGGLELVLDRGRGASMGPRPSGRGTALGRIGRRHAPLRQWGRGRVAAERFLPNVPRSMSLARQWGRGRVAAERACPVRSPPESGASMGPRPSGRGTSATQATAPPPAPRQWGRGRVAAERTTSRRWAVRKKSRQWGRGRVAAERARASGGR